MSASKRHGNMQKSDDSDIKNVIGDKSGFVHECGRVHLRPVQRGFFPRRMPESDKDGIFRNHHRPDVPPGDPHDRGRDRRGEHSLYHIEYQRERRVRPPGILRTAYI